ncbi:MAG: hypothetical protein JXQ83_15140, partial [Candidatus Glassbacteria bacterium]|nr:hypothetical protein [Candidatus Glassbacteria bacterium]
MTTRRSSLLPRLASIVWACLLLGAGTAFAQNNITVGTVQGTPGSEAAVAITVTSGEPVAGISFDLSFDPAKLQIKSVSNGAATTGMTPVGVNTGEANTSGTLKVSLVDFSFSNPVAAGTDKEVYLVTFTVSADADGEIPVELSNTSLSNPSGGDIPAVVNNGKVVVEAGEPEPVLEATLTVTTEHSYPGQEIVLPVLLSSNAEISGAEFIVLYDPAVLQAEGAEAGSDAEVMTVETGIIEEANASGQWRVNIFDMTGSRLEPGTDKELVLLTFTVSPEAEGELTVGLDDATVSFVDEDFNVEQIMAGTGAGMVIVDEEVPPVLTPTDISVVGASAAAGSDVTVKIVAGGENIIAGAGFTVVFDPAKLQIKQVDKGADAPAMTPVGVDLGAANSDGSLEVSLVDFSFSNPIAAGESKEIYLVTFTIAAGAAEGEIPISLEEVSLSDPSGADIPVEVSAGAVAVTGGVTPIPTEPGEATLKVVGAEGQAGSEVAARVLITADQDFAALGFDLVFDNSLLQIVSLGMGGDVSEELAMFADIQSSNRSGTLNVDMQGRLTPNTVTPVPAGEDLEVLTVTFKISSSAAGGNTALELRDYSVLDPESTAFTVAAQSGTIRISGSTPGPGPTEPPMDANFLWSRAVSGTEGQTVTATLDLNSLVQVAGVSFNVAFDNSLIRLTEVKPSGNAARMTLVGFNLSDANSTGEFGVSMVDFSFSNPIVAGLGPILQISFTFQAAGKAEFTVDGLSLSDAGGSDIPAEVFYSDVPVVVENHRPSWQQNELRLTLTEGEAFSYTFDAPEDEDAGDVVVVAARSLPEGARFDAAGLGISWTPGLEAAGVYQFILVATDQDGAKGTLKVTLVVGNSNQPPLLLLPERPVETREGTFLGFTVKAYDPDHERVEITASGLPEGSSFLDPVFTWEDPVEGEYTITLAAADPAGLQAAGSLTIRVIGVNDPPVFDQAGDVNVEAGQQVKVELSASDPDGDELVYSLVVTGENNILRRGAAFSVNVFTWTPTDKDIGPNILTFVVKDPAGLKDRMQMTLTVTGRNIVLPPCFEVFQKKEIQEAEELVFVPVLLNPSTEGYKFWVDGLPEGGEFDEETGTLTWTPTLLQAGRYVITFGVSDGSFQDLDKLVVKVADKDVMPELSPIGDLTVYE